MTSGAFGSMEALAQRLQGKRGSLKWRVPGSAAWAELETDPKPADLASFVGSLASDGHSSVDSASEPLRYLHDWSLPRFHPELAAKVSPLPYFADDILSRCSDGTMLADSWPSLFVGPQGSRSSLHVDSGGTHFWMAVTSGEKFWRVFPRSELALLGPVWTPGTFDPHLACGAADGDPTAPAASDSLQLTSPWEGVVRAGDVIFIPANCAHFVLNLTDTIAVSANYVDESNVDLALDELGPAALQDPRARRLVQELKAAAVAPTDNTLRAADSDPRATKRPRVESVDSCTPVCVEAHGRSDSTAHVPDNAPPPSHVN